MVQAGLTGTRGEHLPTNAKRALIAHTHLVHDNCSTLSRDGYIQRQGTRAICRGAAHASAVHDGNAGLLVLVASFPNATRPPRTFPTTQQISTVTVVGDRGDAAATTSSWTQIAKVCEAAVAVASSHPFPLPFQTRKLQEP